MVFYGMTYAILAKFLIMGAMSGIFQLFSVWIAYYSWATMSPCNLIFQMVNTGLDLMIILSGWSQIAFTLADKPILLTMFYLMVGIYSASFIVEYLAYRCFKEQSDD